MTADLNDWVHDDGTPCPEYLAPDKGIRWWCTTHQQYLRRPDPVSDAARPARENGGTDNTATDGNECPRCGSWAPHLHPATHADGGEVQPCPHPFHDPIPGHVRGCLRPWEKSHAVCPVAAGD